MRQADENTIKNGTPSLVLMERAGFAIASVAERALENIKIKSVAVFCGGGNNGGDGFVAARLLSERGYDTHVICFAEKFSRDCEAVKALYKGDIYGVFPKLRAGLIIDCLFGTGLNGELVGKNAEAVNYINNSGAFVVSADIPSGINGDNGLVMGVAVKADITVCIAQYKNGLFLNDGKDYCGKIEVADIGINGGDTYLRVLEREDIKGFFKKRKSNSNKGSYGKSAIISGSSAYNGAPALCAKACLRGGAGYTYLCLPKKLYPHYIAKLPEAILLEFYGESEHKFDEGDLNEIIGCQAIAIGPGVGVSEEIYRIVNYLLKNYKGKLVIDADALNSLAKFGVDTLKEKTCEVILTPHVKEFSRLAKKSVLEINKNLIEEAECFAREYGVTLLLKSNTSVITDGKDTFLNALGSPSLAKGGSGDTLTGLLCSLCAYNDSDLECCCAASGLTSLSASYCEKIYGEFGVIASDVAESYYRALL